MIAVLLTFLPFFLKLGGLHLRLSVALLISVAFLFALIGAYRNLDKAFLALLAFYSYIFFRELITMSLNFEMALDQTLKLLIFSIFFTRKYDGISLNLLTILASILVVMVVIFHWLSGAFIGYKLIGEAKFLFGLVPLLLYFSSAPGGRLVWMAFMVVLALSLERKAMLAFATVIAPKFIDRYVGRVGLIALSVVVGFLLINVLAFLVPILIETIQTFSTIEDIKGFGAEQVSDRQRIWQIAKAYEAVQGNLYLGGGYNFTLRLFEVESAGMSSSVSALHNVPLTILLDFGLFGLCLWLIFVVAYYRAFVRHCKVRAAIFGYVMVYIMFIPLSFYSDLLLFLPMLISRRVSDA